MKNIELEIDLRPLMACGLFALREDGAPALGGVRCYFEEGALMFVATDRKALLAVRLKHAEARPADAITIPLSVLDMATNYVGRLFTLDITPAQADGLRMVGLWTGAKEMVFAGPEPEGKFPDRWREVLPLGDLRPSCPPVSLWLLRRIADAADILGMSPVVRLFSRDADESKVHYAALDPDGGSHFDVVCAVMPMRGGVLSGSDTITVPAWAYGGAE